MRRIRLSFSLLSLWKQGKIDQAVESYFHIPSSFQTPAMDAGLAIHQEIAEHVKTHNSFPNYLPCFSLNSPITEKKVVTKFNDLFELSGQFDLIDGETLYEYKTGVTDSMEWAQSGQLSFYFYLCSLVGLPVKTGILIHYNQHLKEHDFTIVHNGPGHIESAINEIETIGPEIHHYFTEQGLV